MKNQLRAKLSILLNVKKDAYELRENPKNYEGGVALITVVINCHACKYVLSAANGIQRHAEKSIGLVPSVHGLHPES